jgi:hypothetical protein
VTDDRGRGGRTFSHEELDEMVASLYGVGGIYELVAYEVERGERRRCTGEPTNVRPPWQSS